MELLTAFMSQSAVAQASEIVTFASTVTMAMPTSWKDNAVMDIVSKILNFVSLNILKNKNADDK